MSKLAISTTVEHTLENSVFSFSDSSAYPSITLPLLKGIKKLQIMLKNNYHYVQNLWYINFNIYSVYAFNIVGADRKENFLSSLFQALHRPYQVSCKEKIMFQGNTNNILSKWGKYGLRNLRYSI